MAPPMHVQYQRGPSPHQGMRPFAGQRVWLAGVATSAIDLTMHGQHAHGVLLGLREAVEVVARVGSPRAFRVVGITHFAVAGNRRPQRLDFSVECQRIGVQGIALSAYFETGFQIIFAPCHGLVVECAASREDRIAARIVVGMALQQ